MKTNRELAIEKGDKTYLGKPCPKGHIGIRYVISSSCAECLKYKPNGRSRGKPNANRQLAIENGDQYYFSDKPCKNGHTSKHVTKTSRCVECHEIYKITKRKASERGYSLKKSYGITLEEYNKMLEAQNFVCKICGLPEKSLTGKGDKLKPLAVDHCHNTGKIRALLCSRCNIGIGSLMHDPKLLRLAALYCEEF